MQNIMMAFNRERYTPPPSTFNIMGGEGEMAKTEIERVLIFCEENVANYVVLSFVRNDK